MRCRTVLCAHRKLEAIDAMSVRARQTRERRAFALETIDAGMRSADLECCAADVDGVRVCVREDV